MLVIPMLITGATLSLLLVSTSLPVLIVVMVITGLVNGPADIALFTLRQRRTDPAWMGRAFAVSMSLNFIGFPVGSAIGGALAPVSLELAFLGAIVLDVIAAVLSFVLIPKEHTDPFLTGATAPGE